MAASQRIRTEERHLVNSGLSATFPEPGDSGIWFGSDAIIDRRPDPLLAAKISLGCLNRDPALQFCPVCPSTGSYLRPLHRERVYLLLPVLRVNTGEPSGATLISVLPPGRLRGEAFQAGDCFKLVVSEADAMITDEKQTF